MSFWQRSVERSRFVAFVCSAAALVAGLVFASCSEDEATPGAPRDAGNGDTATTQPDSGNPNADSGSPVHRAKATIAPTSDASTVSGLAEFTQREDVVTVDVSIRGATPGPHGLHIHAGDNCGPTVADGGAVTPGGGAGGHWNPSDAGHGFPDAATHHLGDLGNIAVDGAGNGTLTFRSSEFRVVEGPVSVVGHAIVFHQGSDDGATQPTGDAGARPGCGVIQREP